MDSYEVILNRMTDEYSRLSGSYPNNESDIMLRMKTLSAEIYNLGVLADYIKRQILPSTAEGEHLENHAMQRGLSRKQAVKATGSVTFSTLQPATEDIIIDKGTVVCTAAPDARYFVTDEIATIRQGSTTVTVNATAQIPGADHNVSANTICVLVTPPIGVTGVTNSVEFRYGCDSETDEELRSRLLESYKDISNGTNAIYYKRLMESVDGVYSAGIVPHVRGDGTLNIYVCAKGDRVSASLIGKLQQIADENRELNVDIEVLHASCIEISLTLNLSVENGYSFITVSDNVKQRINSYISALGIGHPVLLSDLSDVIYHTEGVKNYSFLNSFCSDHYPSNSQYCIGGTISIRQVS